MAVFILAVIVNNYTTGQVGGCLNTSLSVCLLEIQISEHIHSLPSTERRLLSGPAVTLKDHSLVYCVFLGDIGYVTVLSPTVTSAISVSVPQPPLRWHFITAGVTSACCWRPVFNPRSLLCLTLIKRPGVRCRDVARHFMESTRTRTHFLTLYSTKKYSTITPFRSCSWSLWLFFCLVVNVIWLIHFSSTPPCLDIRVYKCDKS